MRRRFQQVDVFTDEPYLGNPVAVVLDGDGVATEDLQGFARWTNLSETTFVLPPVDPLADYRVRIFTTDAELPFAGHPTLGTCHAWLRAGGTPHDPEVVVQECGIGLVPVRRAGSRLAFAAPPLRRDGPLDADLLARVTTALGMGHADVVDARWADNGPGWIGVLLADAAAVLSLAPDLAGLGELHLGVAGAHPEGAETAVEVRTFFPASGTSKEDPVTGSFNASLAQWLLATGRLQAPYVASQGTAIGRRGRIHVDQDAMGTVWVGGSTVTCIEGDVEL